MKGVTHQLFGITCYVYAPITTGHVWLDLVLVATGALIPDIDHPKSMLGQCVKPLSMLIHQFAGHRGPFHSLLMTAIMAYALLNLNVLLTTIFPFLPLNMWSIVTLGTVTHLIGDMVFGKSGVPLFWPIMFRVRIVPASFGVGGSAEFLASLGLTILCLVKNQLAL